MASREPPGWANRGEESNPLRSASPAAGSRRPGHPMALVAADRGRPAGRDRPHQRVRLIGPVGAMAAEAEHAVLGRVDRPRPGERGDSAPNESDARRALEPGALAVAPMLGDRRVVLRGVRDPAAVAPLA